MDRCLLTSVADAEQWVRVSEDDNITLTASKLVVEANEGFYIHYTYLPFSS